ncbi:MAG TPA: hemerythrin domain-containing protein [Mycobacterium sp.]|jgi:hemerythrin-like domain-containing protein
MPADAFEMALVHRVFRDELRCAPILVGSVQPGQGRRLKRVVDHIANVLSALHHHHMAEDELLWPKLHERTPEHAEIIRHMETEHELIATSVDKVHLLLADWIATAHSASAAQRLISGIKELTELVDAHLVHEEERIVPLINENITSDEWRAATGRGASFISGRNIAFAIAFAGMTLDSCTADEYRRFLACMPSPQRLLVRLFARRVGARYRARLRAF